MISLDRWRQVTAFLKKSGLLVALSFGITAAFLVTAATAVEVDDLLAGKEWQAGFHRTGTTTYGTLAAAADLGDGERVYFLGLLQALGPESRQVAGEELGIHWLEEGQLQTERVPELQRVRVVRSLNDAEGPALYAAGQFGDDFPADREDRVWGVVRWDGLDFERLPAPDDDVVEIHDVATFASSGLSEVYCSGLLETGDGFVARLVGGFDGGSWQRIGEAHDAVRALVVLGSGPDARLVASQSIDGQSGSGLGTWDGDTWSGLGGQGMPRGDVVNLLEDGPRLVASVRSVGSVSNGDRVALFSDDTWTTIGTVDEGGGTVGSLATFETAYGRRLAVSSVTSIDGVAATGLATWSAGTGWRAIPGALPESTRCMASTVSDSAPGLYCDGGFLDERRHRVFGFARWTGSQWAAVPEDPESGLGLEAAGTVARLDDGSAPAIYATVAWGLLPDGEPAQVARLIESGDGPIGWEAIGGRFLERGGITKLADYDDGNGSALYAAGSFTTLADGTYAGGLVRFDGSAWRPVPSPSGVGFEPEGVELDDLLVHDDGSGPKLYVAGCIEAVGSLPVTGVARFDGTDWEALPPLGSLAGSAPCVQDLLTDPNDGSLLVVGGFDLAGGLDARHVARWNGSQWSAVAADKTQDGSRAAVYRATIGPGPSQPLCVAGFLRSLSPWFDLGTRVACLDESGAWQELSVFDSLSGDPNETPWVLDLEWSTDGRLVAFGWGRTIDGETVNLLAAWRDGVWRPFEGPHGVGVPDAYFSGDFLLDTRADGTQELWLALGVSSSAGGLASSGVARWAACDGSCMAQVFADGFEGGSTAGWSRAIP